MPSAAEGLSYILIEGFGTRGLQGNEHQYDDLDDDVKRNDFYYFWRNIGRTRKGDTDLGRWGLGKTVFQAASRINSFFGFTVRRDDGRALFMGQSVLKIHKLNGTRYAPYGYSGKFNGELALPVEEPADVQSYCENLNLGRQGRPGLTILVPYPDQDIVATDCLKSAVKHYFSPILAGELVIELGKAEDHFIRQGITIPEVSSLKHKGIRAIVSISERDLSDVLRKIAIRL